MWIEMKLILSSFSIYPLNMWERFAIEEQEKDRSNIVSQLASIVVYIFPLECHLWLI